MDLNFSRNSCRSLCLLVFLLLSIPFTGNCEAFALSEQTLETDYNAFVAPLLANRISGTFSGVEGKSIAYAFFAAKDAANGLVVLVPGYTESYLQYGEVIYDLTQAGFSVFAIDHRGMGLSERLAADPQIVHIDSFGDYIKDLEQFVSQVVQPKATAMAAPMFLLGHSLGGLVGAGLMAKKPTLFAKAALTAPLFDLNTGSLPETLAYWAVTFNEYRGAGQNYAPGFGPFDAEGATVETSTTTHSAVRFAILKNLWLTIPETLMSGPSNSWIRTILRATWRRDELADKIKTPILLFQASNDHFADAPGQNSFCAKTKTCERIPVSGSMHAILNEKDAVRAPVMAAILTFFGQKAAAPSQSQGDL